ncbi:glycoside hydrolase family 43 protein [Agromyces fucosus]|uniref:Glycoside hydrolase family 43 protein n=1 Tax=Agromyces fucosus TaxID=41985 RepID=A0A4Q2JV56_9MICO|nr:glycoside hydrolase family 43 protein [Agromyces fucosus]RXZ51244.1 glycoside hydrolase family 43 protein [Agromyces fucosus]
MTAARNPVLPGFHPDPSICRVGDEFFVVTSTFEYFPGLPVHRSRDLVEWELIGHVVHREDQLDLSTVAASGGLFAPTIRHHDGRFFVVCTLVGGEGRQGNFVVTATDPAGPWSDPAWIEEAAGIDPSLLFDDDGRAWWCGTRLAEPGEWHDQTEVWVRELDLATMTLVGEEHVVWHGAVEGAVWAEGPHLYRLDGEVLLLASEGGTDRHHAVSAARGARPAGPFTGSKANPLLTHRHLGGGVGVANVGHADLVDDGRGGWWATALATRRLPIGDANADVARADALQGRETWLVPVTFEDGWPVFAPGAGRLRDEVDVPWAEGPAAGPTMLVDDFDGLALHPELLTVRTAVGSPRVQLGERPGHLRLHAVSGSLAELAPHAFAGFRLEQPTATLATVVEVPDAAPPGMVAGLALRLSEHRHLTFGVRPRGSGRVVELVLHVDGEDRVLGRAEMPGGRVGLVLEIDGFAAIARLEHDERRSDVGSADLAPLSPSTGGGTGFAGVVGGVFAIGAPGTDEHGAAGAAWADFDLLSLVHTAEPA